MGNTATVVFPPKLPLDLGVTKVNDLFAWDAQDTLKHYISTWGHGGGSISLKREGDLGGRPIRAWVGVGKWSTSLPPIPG